MAMTKVCEGGVGVSVAQEVCETYSSSLDTALRQRAQELQHLSQDRDLRAKVLPREAGSEPLEVTHLRCRITTIGCNIVFMYPMETCCIGNIKFDHEGPLVLKLL